MRESFHSLHSFASRIHLGPNCIWRKTRFYKPNLICRLRQAYHSESLCCLLSHTIFGFQIHYYQVDILYSLRIHGYSNYSYWHSAIAYVHRLDGLALVDSWGIKKKVFTNQSMLCPQNGFSRSLLYKQKWLLQAINPIGFASLHFYSEISLNEMKLWITFSFVGSCAEISHIIASTRFLNLNLRCFQLSPVSINCPINVSTAVKRIHSSLIQR